MTGIRLYDLEPDELPGSPKGYDASKLQLLGKRVTSVAWHPDGKRIALASQDKVVRYWDVSANPVLLSVLASPDVVADMAFSADGLFLTWASLDGQIRLWDLDESRTPREIGNHAGPAIGLSFRNRGIVSAGADGTLRFWDPAHGGETRKPVGFTTPGLVTFSRDGRLCASTGIEGDIRILDPASGRQTVSRTPTRPRSPR